MLKFKIDHFVIGCKKLEDGSHFLESLLRENLSEINKHTSMGTHNKVISLGGNYLEVISNDPSSGLKNKNSWFELDNKLYTRNHLKYPKLISFVISGKKKLTKNFYEKKFLVSRNNFKWFFQKPNKQLLIKNEFKNINSFPSIIDWLSPSPIHSMIKSSFKFISLDITLNYNQKFYKKFISSLFMEENINFKFTSKNLKDLPSLELKLKSEKNNREIIIS